jgi:putative glutamine amidotransferase
MRVSNSEECRDAISHDWIHYLQKLDWDIILMPNLLNDVTRFIDQSKPDALILTGGNDIGASINRDITETHALRWFQVNRLPVLGVCRGMEMINTFYGGTLLAVPQTHNGKTHTMELIHPQFINWAGQHRVVTNSFHNFGVVGLAPCLEPAAVCEGIIESVIHKKDKVVGIQWHPEREHSCSSLDIRLFHSLENNYSELGYP